MTRYKHIVFDIDGTLVDTQYAVLMGLKDAVKELSGREMTLDELVFTFGIPGEEALRQLGFADPKAALVTWNVHIRKYREHSKLFPGVEKLFENLDGVEIGVVTSKTYAEYVEEFMRFPIGARIATAVCADHTARHKPEPEPLFKYMELTGARKEEILYVGDSIYDEQCAHRAGVDFALATWGATNKQLPAAWYPESPEALFNPIFN